ncbi:hypothetical protein ACQPXS_45310 [Streptomyces sp. CA-142005]|uniref:hypothetical protein n=1 Tax=Streptomyces sp. CA-142005 TaxID=3240052 RepID=UPI003D8FEEA7
MLDGGGAFGSVLGGAGLGVEQCILAVPREPGCPDDGPSFVGGQLRTHHRIGQLDQAVPGRGFHCLVMVGAQRAEQYPATLAAS